MPLALVHRITVFVPAGHEDAFKRAVLAVDDLAVGDYSEALWCTRATEQFRPGIAANPTHGRPGELSIVGCVRMELSIPRDAQRLESLLAAIHAAHPWEVPAVFVDEAWFALP